jgi:hypothetical protein
MSAHKHKDITKPQQSITSTRRITTRKPPSITHPAITKAGHHAHTADAHGVHATHHAHEAAKHHVEHHGEK